ncbi:glutamine amidotransferase [uncultured Herbaspirillum sp.]|uniref:glutamine amidotransferase n=1 Tax=uncultured Herbaspirillum sp. TaxID=160236 RepID=UPI0026086D6F|nr:glutamine amidotransferase [uncultured Herbaspirillum sp.]
MKQAIALRHLHFEDAGIIEPVLKERGYQLRYIDAVIDPLDDPAIEHADLMIVLGGPIGANDEVQHPFLARELDLINRRLQRGQALLGICLGAQLIARALGARVYPMGVKEIGFAPLTLNTEARQSVLAALDQLPVLHWHGDQFDIPSHAQALAATATCPNQAFRLGAQVLALQFHLEADTRRIGQWLVGHACELAQAGIDPCGLRKQAALIGPVLEVAGRRVIERWLDEMETL